jgi:hypothetical protein
VKDQLAWKAEHLGSELGRRTRDFGEKSEELKLLARKQEEAAKTIEKLERKLMEKIEAESRCGEMSLEKLRF